MLAAAVRGYLADVLQGRRSLLVVRTDAIATELSAQIRAELVAAGRVSAEVLGQTRDGNLIGVGDLIQARLNDYTLRVHGSRPVTNREVYEVLGRNRVTGTLTVRDRDGILAHLPDAYVQQHTTLAYAVTAYGAQGQTVDTSHSLIDRGTTRAGGVRAGQPRPRRQHLLRRLPARPRPPRPRADRQHTGGGADRHPHPPRRRHPGRRAGPPRRGRGNPLAGLGRHPVGPADRRVRPPPRHRHPHPTARPPTSSSVWSTSPATAG